MQKIKNFTGKNGEIYETEDSIVVWRALKFLAEGEAQRLVINTRDENGFAAWLNLSRFFDPRLALQMEQLFQNLHRCH